MKAKWITGAAILLPLVGFTMLKTVPLDPASTLSVQGGSTVRSWKCQAQKIDAQVATEDGVAIGQFVQAATVVIPIAQLDCGNGTMNEHMRKALKADANPNIEFKLSSYDVSGADATLKGTLTIAGETRPIEIPGTIAEQGGDVRVKAATQINMTQWGVKPPSLMLGAMKVKPDVTVSFDVALKK